MMSKLRWSIFKKKDKSGTGFIHFFLIFFRAGLLLCTFLRQEGRKVPFLSLFSKSVNLLKLKLFRGQGVFLYPLFVRMYRAPPYLELRADCSFCALYAGAFCALGAPLYASRA